MHHIVRMLDRVFMMKMIPAQVVSCSMDYVTVDTMRSEYAVALDAEMEILGYTRTSRVEVPGVIRSTYTTV